jgi:hypothetical protein
MECEWLEFHLKGFSLFASLYRSHAVTCVWGKVSTYQRNGT